MSSIHSDHYSQRETFLQNSPGSLQKCGIPAQASPCFWRMYHKFQRVRVNRMTKHINAYVVIFSLVTVLTLATASECHSITYLPSPVVSSAKGKLWPPMSWR